ncbi:hypothetical protein GUJ93_ZPchr0001g32166 [Zizania palustris]|uniref:Uncharacterized protein n=1 Tax=Zizania palustris TaxID=103762 RepID=A0A8J5RL35_ZIZPA|nr:hypothetical protein GUJ93_ZPchr0001g32166 [Zizania palustris]
MPYHIFSPCHHATSSPSSSSLSPHLLPPADGHRPCPPSPPPSSSLSLSPVGLTSPRPQSPSSPSPKPPVGDHEAPHRSRRKGDCVAVGSGGGRRQRQCPEGVAGPPVGGGVADGRPKKFGRELGERGERRR